MREREREGGVERERERGGERHIHSYRQRRTVLFAEVSGGT